MPGSGLVAIKRRIKSITNTMKITKAMGLVATSKLRKTRERLGTNDKFYSSLADTYRKVLSTIDEDTIYLKSGNNRKLYIVFTSDTGLCGAFNSSVVNSTLSQINKDRENSLVMVVGQKGRAYFRRLRVETVAEYVELPTIPELKDAYTIAMHALNMYRKGEIGEINVLYHKFHNAVKQTIETERVLPLSFPDTSNVNDSSEFAFEPNGSNLMESNIEFFLKHTLLHFMMSSKVSEQSARMTAMDSASKNAGDLLEKLQLQYNRVRQSSITQEISEIVGGATAQK